MSTIQVDEETLGDIKIYCVTHNIKVKDFVKILCKKDKEFMEFNKGIRKLHV